MNQVLATSESQLYVGHEGYFLHLFSQSLLITPGFVSTHRIHIIMERSRESLWSKVCMVKTTCALEVSDIQSYPTQVFIVREVGCFSSLKMQRNFVFNQWIIPSLSLLWNTMKMYDLWECFTEVLHVVCLFQPNLTYIPHISHLDAGNLSKHNTELQHLINTSFIDMLPHMWFGYCITCG